MPGFVLALWGISVSKIEGPFFVDLLRNKQLPNPDSKQPMFFLHPVILCGRNLAGGQLFGWGNFPVPHGGWGWVDGVLLCWAFPLECPSQLHSHVWGLGETENPNTHLWPLLKAVKPPTQSQGSRRKGSRKSRSKL